MKAIGIIPARLGSTRLQAKVLVDIGGKPMIQHVWERCRKSKRLSQVIVACDDKKILKAVEGFGGKAVLTRRDHPSGTDRIAEAARNIKADVIINIQGDEPLIHYSIIDGLVDVFAKDKLCQMATVIKKVSDPKDITNPNVVKVVVDDQGYALYFSRSAIPFNRDGGQVEYFKHLGIYGYRKNYLFKFTKLKKSRLEIAEKLEQLRALQAGYRIKTIQTHIETVSVDTHRDLSRVKKMVK